MRAALAVLVVLAVTPWAAFGAPAATPAPPPTAPPGDPHIVSVYPNPAVEDDRGEFVEIAAPRGATGTLTLTDGEDVVEIPAGRSGRLAVASDRLARNLTAATVHVPDRPLRLVNGGERVELRLDGRPVDAVTYPRAPEGAVYRRVDGGWTWRRLGATSFPVRRVRADAATLFVLPDAPTVPLEALRTADRRLWLAAYTLTSRRVVDALCAARRRGVDTRVLAEREPVGGMAVSQARRLDALVACGVRVRVIGGPHARYAFHHAKYAIADDRAVVLTENWKPSGVGGRSSRGWGAVVAGADVADALAATYGADAGWRDARPWAEVRSDQSVDRTESPANGTFPAVFTPVAVDRVAVEVLVAPENAERRVVALIDGADESIRAIQLSVGGARQPFVRALVRAARRGVSVELLLADAWYVREHNRAVANALEERARAEGFPLEVRLATPRGRYEKIHAKGAVIDGEQVLVGSLNWNNASARRNREVAIVLHGEAVGRYYARVFDADWQGGRWRVPAGLVATVVGLAIGAGTVARRTIEFDADRDEGVRPAAREEDRGVY